MAKFQTEAVVLRVMDYRESDKLVTFYSRDHGKISGIAKSAKKSRRRFGTVLGPFNILSLIFSRRRSSPLVFIEEASLVFPLLRLLEDLKKIGAASYFVELVSELSREGEPNRGEYELLKRYLQLLDGKPFDENLVRRFELSLLSYAGLKPEVESCLRCQRPLAGEKSAFFVFQEGGCFCGGCLPPHQPYEAASLEARKFLSDVIGEGDVDCRPKVQRELRRILPAYLKFFLGKELRTRIFMEKVFSNRHLIA